MWARGALIAFSVLLAAAAGVLVVEGPSGSTAVLATASAMFFAAAVIAAWMAVWRNPTPGGPTRSDGGAD